ncbi:MAG: hypothetical protein H6662_02810 [Ardenticatenaceae bacterium]|nr:hypothetical protein [Ardenticatenaceae bacterium]
MISQRLFGETAVPMQMICLAADAQFRPAGLKQWRLFRVYGVKRPFLLTVGERRPHKNHLGLL